MKEVQLVLQQLEAPVPLTVLEHVTLKEGAKCFVILVISFLHNKYSH